MCGILGQITFTGANLPAPQLNLLHHRGPDGKGEWTNDKGSIYLGHTRLAILEPTPAGQQPMVDSSKRFTIVFNGEIYNHLKLRELLPEVKWRGNSDTETLLELLAQKGLDALHLIKGMFAFALCDSLENSFFLVRDRLGIKPLWYCKSAEKISFSSEIRALVAPGANKISQNALSEYIAFGRMPSTGAIFEGVQALPPGSWLKVEANGRIQQEKWWSQKGFSKTAPAAGRKELSQQVKQLVITAVEEHLISDVGVGAFLSGGIDSSIITLVAGKALGKSLETFTIGFPQKTFDERAIARLVAKKAGTAHHELEISPDQCLVWVKEAVSSLDLPSVDAINTYIVAKAVKESGLKVALSGLGGDEIFGGYPSFKNVPWLQLVKYLPSEKAQRAISFMPKTIRDKIQGLDQFTVTGLTSAHRRFTSIASLEGMGLQNGVPDIPLPPPGLDRMGQISWAEIYGYMIPMLLRDSDQMSMAVGLEIRVPFLDHHLVETVLGMSQRLKKGRGVKGLLVEAFKDDLPTEVYNRPKQGFTLPMDEWIQSSLVDFAQKGILSAADFLSLVEPLQQFNEYKKGNLHWTRIWLWVVLGHWLAKQQKRPRP